MKQNTEGYAVKLKSVKSMLIMWTWIYFEVAELQGGEIEEHCGQCWAWIASL